MQLKPAHVECKIYEGAEATQRLHEMGLREKYFHDAATRGNDRRSRCLPVHPRAYAGQVMWAETVGEIRTQLLDLGQDWEIGRLNNYDTVYSSSRQISIAVVGGDVNTGERAFEHPMTARRRGPVTASRIKTNIKGQLSLIEGLPSTDEKITEEQCLTWFFMLNARNNHLYGELSLPVSMGGKKRVSAWAERIILPPLALVGAVTPVEPSESKPSSRRLIKVERKPDNG